MNAEIICIKSVLLVSKDVKREWVCTVLYFFVQFLVQRRMAETVKSRWNEVTWAPWQQTSGSVFCVVSTKLVIDDGYVSKYKYGL
jgi:hypothetical protein